MTRPTEASVVPIRLTLDERAGHTLWATPWEEDGEEWQAFLGAGSRVLVFASADDLAGYLRSGRENDLSDHPRWAELRRLPADQLEPEEGYEYDLDGVYDLVAADPDPFTVSELSDLLDLVERIAECCDDTSLLALLEDTPEFAQLLSEDPSYSGTENEERWSELGRAFGRTWELVLARLGACLQWVPAGSAASAEDAGDRDVAGGDTGTAGNRSGPTASGRTETPGPGPGRPDGRRPAGATAADAGVAAEVDEDPERDGGDGTDVWERAGILPVRITVPAGTGYTLRTYAGPDDEAVFLGSDMTVDVFRSMSGLAGYCRVETGHDLAELSTWAEIQAADPLVVTVGDEEDYDLGRPTEPALELAADLAEYCRLEAVTEALGDDGTPPADWDAALAEIVSCLRWRD